MTAAGDAVFALGPTSVEEGWEDALAPEDMLGDELSNLSTSARLTLGHAMRRTSQMLLESIAKHVPGITAEAGEVIEPILPATTPVPVASDAASALAVEASHAAAAVASMREAERTVEALRSAWTVASQRAETSLKRLCASQNREAELEAQLAEVEGDQTWALTQERDAVLFVLTPSTPLRFRHLTRFRFEPPTLSSRGGGAPDGARPTAADGLAPASCPGVRRACPGRGRIPGGIGAARGATCAQRGHRAPHKYSSAGAGAPHRG